MTNTIQVKRGANASLPTLNAGEFGFSTDTYQVYIGDGATNHEIAALDLSNEFIAAQKIDVNSSTAFVVEQDGVHDNVLLVDTTNGRVSINTIGTAGAFQIEDFIDPWDYTSSGTIDGYNVAFTTTVTNVSGDSDLANIVISTIANSIDASQDKQIGLLAGIATDTTSTHDLGEVIAHYNETGHVSARNVKSLAAAINKVTIASGSGNVTSSVYANYGWVDIKDGAGSVPYVFGAINSITYYNDSAAVTGYLVGSKSNAYIYNNTMTVPLVYAAIAEMMLNGTTTVTEAIVHMSQADLNAGSITDLYLYKADVDGAATSVTNIYGLYVDDITVGSTLNYAIYTNAGDVHFGDNVSINGNLAVDQASTTAFVVEQDGVHDDVLVVDTVNGWVGINIAPDTPLEISSTSSQLKLTYDPGVDEATLGVDDNGLLGISSNGGIYLYADPGQASRSILAANRTMSNAGSVYGYNFDVHQTGAGGVYGMLAFVYSDADSGTGTAAGAYYSTQVTGAYTLGNLYGVFANVNSNTGALISGNVSGFYSDLNGDLGTITGKTSFFYVSNDITAGTIPNLYGLYVEALTQGVNNYAIYTNAGDVRFGDNTSIAGNLDFEAAATISTTAGDLTLAPAADVEVSANLNATGYITAIGGVHVGSASDPGTDNLVVDGDITGGNVTSGTDPGHLHTVLYKKSAYWYDADDTPRSMPLGITNGFVKSADGDNFPNYGSLLVMNTYTAIQDGGVLQMYVPYSSSLGGTEMQYRMGQYDNAGWTSWKTIVDTSGADFTGLITTTGGIHVGGTSDPGNDDLIVDQDVVFGYSNGDVNQHFEIVANNSATSRVYPWIRYNSEGNLIINSGSAGILRFQTDVPSQYAVFSSYLAVLGGTHVGSTSDPGDDNLIVDGKVSIGTSTQTYPLHLSANYAGYAFYIHNDGNANTRNGIRIDAGTDLEPTCYYIAFHDGNGSELAWIEGDGAGGVLYKESSDIRYKNVIENIQADKSMAAIRDIDTFFYTSKNTPDGNRAIGMSAQAIHEHFPEITGQNEKGRYYMSYGKLTPILWSATKDIDLRLAQVEAEIISLKERIIVLEAA